MNGLQTVLSVSGWGWATDIVISDSNVYITGADGWDDFGNALYWINGERITLPKTGSRLAGANGINISGSDIYIAGFDDNDAVYWFNGWRTVLPREENRSTAIAISV